MTVRMELLKIILDKFENSVILVILCDVLIKNLNYFPIEMGKYLYYLT